MKKIVCPAILLFIVHSLAAQKTYIWCGSLIDGVSSHPKNSVTIVVEKNKIVSVDNGFTSGGTRDKTIDLKTKTVMPGWIDLHVHLSGETSPSRYLEAFQLNDADYAYRSVVFAERTLLTGFTSVRDAGGGVIISLKKAVNQGLIKGPRVFTAGVAIGSTGSHADPTNGYRDDLIGDPNPKIGVANGVDECIKAVRQRYKEGSDVIKIMSTGGVLSVAASGSGAQFTEEEIKAIVSTCKGLRHESDVSCTWGGRN